MVNGIAFYFPQAYFCEFLPIFGQILRFQNTFKYIRTCEINRDMEHFSQRVRTPVFGNCLAKSATW
jgi:hypothetical protein